MNPSNLLIDAVSSLPGLFKANELAYLSLTAKIENPVRDRIAYKMHSSSRSLGITVAREWNRRDLAILRSSGSDSDCMVLLEIKAMYSFNSSTVSSRRDEYIHHLHDDVSKAKSSADSSTNIFFLLLVTHPLSSPPVHLKKVIKYWGQIKKSFDPPRDADLTWHETFEYLNDSLPSDVDINHGKWHAGEAFGIPVEIGYWLLGPWKLA